MINDVGIRTAISYLFGNKLLGVACSENNEGGSCLTIELKDGFLITWQNLVLLSIALETQNISMERRAVGLGAYDHESTWDCSRPARLVCHR